MKITKQQLKQMIKEELSMVLKEELAAFNEAEETTTDPDLQLANDIIARTEVDLEAGRGNEDLIKFIRNMIFRGIERFAN